MERRAFIASTLALLGAGSAGGAATAAAATRRPVVRSYVTGFRPEAMGVLPGLETGAGLALERAPDRRFDPESVAVRTGDEGVLLGYLPGTHSRILAPLLENGVSLRGRLVAAALDPRPTLRLDVIVAA